MSDYALLVFEGGPYDGQRWMLSAYTREVVIPELPLPPIYVNHRYRRTRKVQDGRTVYRYVVPK